jgi:hypothetical protein
MAILKTGQILGVCVHHSVYKPAKNLAELKAQAALFNSWHKSKSWAETTKTTGDYPYISYHYLIAQDGALLKVTDEKYVKYHAGDNFRGDLSFNLHGIAVCLTGNYQTDKPTEAQMLTLVKLIRDIEQRYDIDARVRGHKETSKDPTACPGINIGTSGSGWLKQVITNVNNKDYPPKPPTPPEPDCSELESKVSELEESIRLLEERIEGLKLEQGALQDQYDKDMATWEDKYGALRSEKDRIASEKAKCQVELSKLKNHRFNWVLEFLDKIIPKKNV